MTGEDGGSTRPRVSVVTTTYHTPPEMLASSLDSILAQTLTDLEMIVVTDGPLGSQQSRVIERLSRDPRLRLVCPGRVGRARALNVGVQTARARLVAIQDADDSSHAQRLERQVRVLDRRSDIDLLGAGVCRSTVPTATVDWVLPPVDARERRSGIRASQVELLGTKLLLGNPLVHSSIVVRRSALEEVGGYSVDRQYQFDHDLYLRMREAGLGLARLADPLVLKRVHADQVFEADGPFAARLFSAWQLQVTHARREGLPRSAALVAAASVRLGARMTRSSIRRVRAGR